MMRSSTFQFRSKNQLFWFESKESKDRFIEKIDCYNVCTSNWPMNNLLIMNRQIDAMSTRSSSTSQVITETPQPLRQDALISLPLPIPKLAQPNFPLHSKMSYHHSVPVVLLMHSFSETRRRRRQLTEHLKLSSSLAVSRSSVHSRSLDFLTHFPFFFQVSKTSGQKRHVPLSGSGPQIHVATIPPITFEISDSNRAQVTAPTAHL